VSTVLLIARRELLDTQRDGRVRLAAGILLVLLLVSLVVGIRHWQQAETRRANAQIEDTRIWQSQGKLNPHSGAHFGHYVFKSAGPLTFVDEGVSPYAGSSVWLEAHRQTPARARPADDAALLPVLGELTAALVLQLLIPLLIVLVSFSSFSGERENGTFRQLLSVGASRTALVLGKALGLVTALFIVLGPLAVLGAGALLVNRSDGTAAAVDFGRLLLLSATYLLYFVAFVGITLAVSARASSSRQALVILVGFWLVANVLVPRLAVDAADHFAPVPTTSVFNQRLSVDISKGISGHDPSDERLDAIKAKLLKDYNVSRVEDLPINFDGVDLAEGERYGNIVMDKHYGELWQQYDRQAAIQRAVAAVSPLLAVRPLSMALAGTGMTDHRDFTNQAEAYRRLTIKQINDWYTIHGKYNQWSDDAGGAELWAQAPPFRHSPTGLRDSLRPQWADFLILLAWALGAVVVASWSLRRTSVDL
jgi:ABC-2 type transport system permease protein